ncbi:hypothetical protein [Magnetospirillum sp. XM-1]|nr:hypothetical protein [Magnetospirillum sp. XM-1]
MSPELFKDPPQDETPSQGHHGEHQADRQIIGQGDRWKNRLNFETA